MVMRQAKNTLGYGNHEQHRYQCLYNPYFSYFLAQKEVELFSFNISCCIRGRAYKFTWMVINVSLVLAVFPAESRASSFCQQVSGVLTAAK